MSRYELTNEEWKRIENLLPEPHTGKGRPAKDNRLMMNGMMWIARSGAEWRELPEKYGPWQTVYAKFRKWEKEGILELVFKALTDDADMENLSIDSTSIRVHQSANGGKTLKIKL